MPRAFCARRPISAERQLRHLVRLVDDLLDLSRLTTGQIALRRELVDVRDVVADALESCRELFAARKQRVTRSFRPIRSWFIVIASGFRRR